MNLISSTYVFILFYVQGKTLMARTIGEILSPARPITVVAGPAIMDKFVGSSEKVGGTTLGRRLLIVFRN